MGSTTQIAVPVRAASPLALWHLLSLDAPSVAALWTWSVALSSGVRLPAASPIAMALAVWIIYAADRLLDAKRAHASGSWAELEDRHLFHHRHRRVFIAGIAAAAVTLGALLPTLDAAAVRLYLCEGAMLIAWFLILHATRGAHRLPKEIAVGIFFSAAVFIPTIARNRALRPALAPAAMLFGLLCTLNCLFIYAWEHRGIPSAQAAHPSTRFALKRLTAIAIAALAMGLALAGLANSAARPLCAGCALSIVLLLALHRHREQLSRIHLRAAADLALLTPALLLPLLLQWR